MARNNIVKKLILGSAQFGEKYGINNPCASLSKRESIKILKFAKSSGINTIDLAERYKSYKNIFNIFKLNRWKVSLKVSYDLVKHINEEKFNYYFFQNLRYLKKQKIEYLIVHNPSLLKKDKGKIFFNNLKKLKKRGLIKKIGVSVYDPNEFSKIIKNYTIDVVQLPLSIFDQRFCSSRIIKQINAKKIEVHARSIFLQGLLISNKKNLKKKYFKNNIKLNQWFSYIKNNKKDAIFECLKFVIKKRFVKKIVFGVNKLDHLKKIIKKLNLNYKTQSLDKFRAHDIKLIDPRKWKKIK